MHVQFLALWLAEKFGNQHKDIKVVKHFRAWYRQERYGSLHSNIVGLQTALKFLKWRQTFAISLGYGRKNKAQCNGHLSRSPWTVTHKFSFYNSNLWQTRGLFHRSLLTASDLFLFWTKIMAFVKGSWFQHRLEFHGLHWKTTRTVERFNILS